MSARTRRHAGFVHMAGLAAVLVTACTVNAPAPHTAPPAAPPRPAPAADPRALAQAKNCMACHAVSQRLAGPAFSAVARVQQANPNALAQMEQRIRAGSVNVWGPVPMPAMPTVSREEAHVLAQWIMSLASAPLPPAAAAPATPPPPAAATAPTRPPVRDPVFDQLALGGVRPGMTRQQAVAALKAYNPRLLTFDAYTATGMNMGELWTGTSVTPGHPGFFSRLVALAPGDPAYEREGGRAESYRSSAQFGIPSCLSQIARSPGRKESVVLAVDFTPSLTDPRVALVRESRYFCRDKAPLDRDLIAELRRKYPMAVSATHGLNDQGTRVGADPSAFGYYAFIEWRAGGPTLRTLAERFGMGDWQDQLARPAMSRAGGGLVLHAEIGIGFPNVMEYQTTLLWSEDAMAERNKQGLLLQRMDEAGVTIGDVNDPKKRARVDMRGIEPPAR